MFFQGVQNMKHTLNTMLFCLPGPPVGRALGRAINQSELSLNPPYTRTDPEPRLNPPQTQTNPIPHPLHRETNRKTTQHTKCWAPYRHQMLGPLEKGQTHIPRQTLDETTSSRRRFLLFGGPEGMAHAPGLPHQNSRAEAGVPARFVLGKPAEEPPAGPKVQNQVFQAPNTSACPSCAGYTLL